MGDITVRRPGAASGDLTLLRTKIRYHELFCQLCLVVDDSTKWNDA